MVASSAETVEMAAEWATAAGRTPNTGSAVAAVERYVGPFGEGVAAFVAAPGFRFEASAGDDEVSD